jgi:hypothetical protein
MIFGSAYDLGSVYVGGVGVEVASFLTGAPQVEQNIAPSGISLPHLVQKGIKSSTFLRIIT